MKINLFVDNKINIIGNTFSTDVLSHKIEEEVKRAVKNKALLEEKILEVENVLIARNCLAR